MKTKKTTKTKRTTKPTRVVFARVTTANAAFMRKEAKRFGVTCYQYMNALLLKVRKTGVRPTLTT